MRHNFTDIGDCHRLIIREGKDNTTPETVKLAESNSRGTGNKKAARGGFFIALPHDRIRGISLYVRCSVLIKPCMLFS